MTFKYSRWRAIYSLIIPVLVVSALAAWAASDWGGMTQRLQGKPLGFVMIVAGLLIWIGGTWPNAILLLKSGITSIRFADDGVTLLTVKGEDRLGRLLRVGPAQSLFSYARVHINTERGGSIELTTSFLKGSQDRSGREIANELRLMSRRSPV